MDVQNFKTVVSNVIKICYEIKVNHHKLITSWWTQWKPCNSIFINFTGETNKCLKNVKRDSGLVLIVLLHSTSLVISRLEISVVWNLYL